jgi:hypothetical protein
MRCSVYKFRWIGLGLIAACLQLSSATLGFAAPRSKPKAEPAAPADAQVTFSGFRAAAGGGGRLMVYLTATPKIRVAQDKDRLVVTFVSTDVGVKNNRNPLDLLPFELPVSRAQLVTRGADVDWVITLKEKVALEPKFVTSSAASSVLEIEVPAAASKQ